MPDFSGDRFPELPKYFIKEVRELSEGTLLERAAGTLNVLKEDIATDGRRLAAAGLATTVTLGAGAELISAAPASAAAYAAPGGKPDTKTHILIDPNVPPEPLVTVTVPDGTTEYGLAVDLSHISGDSLDTSEKIIEGGNNGFNPLMHGTSTNVPAELAKALDLPAEAPVQTLSLRFPGDSIWNEEVPLAARYGISTADLVAETEQQDGIPGSKTTELPLGYTFDVPRLNVLSHSTTENTQVTSNTRLAPVKATLPAQPLPLASPVRKHKIINRNGNGGTPFFYSGGTEYVAPAIVAPSHRPKPELKQAHRSAQASNNVTTTPAAKPPTAASPPETNVSSTSPVAVTAPETSPPAAPTVANTAPTDKTGADANKLGGVAQQAARQIIQLLPGHKASSHSHSTSKLPADEHILLAPDQHNHHTRHHHHRKPISGRELSPDNAGEYTIDSSILDPSGLSLHQLRYALRQLNGGTMLDLADAIHHAEKETGINALYIAAAAGIESADGTSNFARNRLNYFGIDAYTDDPDDASAYPSLRACIESFTDLLWEQYLKRGEVWYGGGSSLHDIYVHYSTSHDSEAESIANLMNQLQTLALEAPLPGHSITSTHPRHHGRHHSHDKKHSSTKLSQSSNNPLKALAARWQ